MENDQKKLDAEVAAKKLAEDASSWAEKQKSQALWQQQQEANTKHALENSPQAQAADAAARQKQESESMGIVKGVFGFMGLAAGMGFAGEALSEKMDGMTSLATLSGKQNAKVFENAAKENNFTIGSPAANVSAAPQMNTAMNFLTPKQNGPVA